MSMSDHEVIVGVSGGIAAYKACTLVSLLRQRGVSVSVVMTHAATQLVAPKTFESLSGRTVSLDLWDSPSAHPHIDLARRASVLCVAPATANCLAKAATGLADDLLSTLLLSFEGTRVFAPAMNVSMWRHPAVQRNVAQIESDGGVIVPCETGRLACGEVGEGRMASPENIAEIVMKYCQ
ncbi:MAG: flavoprotein [Thermoguttaceae bacterium]